MKSKLFRTHAHELWDNDDSEAACKQGWDMFCATHVDDDSQIIEIERDDDAGVFEYDDDAIDFVISQALAGDPLAVKAIFLHGHRTKQRMPVIPREYEPRIASRDRNGKKTKAAKGKKSRKP